MPYPTRLLREPADSTNPGRIGGRSASSTIDGPGLPRDGGLPRVGLSGIDHSEGLNGSPTWVVASSVGRGWARDELLRNLASVFGVIR